MTKQVGGRKYSAECSLTDILSYLFKFKLIFVRELVLFEKWYKEASHTVNVCREVLKTSGFALGFQHFFKCNRKAMNRNWSNQKSNPALKTKEGNK